MAPAARATLAILAARAAIQSPAEAARHHDVSDSLLEVNSSVDEGVVSRNGKNIFDRFFANPASFSTPGPVSGDTSCGMWCSNLGGGTALGQWIFGFGEFTEFTGYFGLQKDVYTYSFNGGEDLVIQWEGFKKLGAEQMAPIFGGWSKERHVLVETEMDGDKGAYRVSADPGIGNSAREVFDTMCAPGGDDGASHKYAIPLQWDRMCELRWLGFPRDELVPHYYYRGAGRDVELLHQDDVTIAGEAMVNTRTGEPEVGWTKLTALNVDTAKAGLIGNGRGKDEERRLLAKMKPFQKGLLVLEYSCHPDGFNPLGVSVGDFKFERIAIYLAK